MCNLPLRFLQQVVGPERTAARNTSPFTRDIVFLDVGLDSVDVLEFEGGYFGTAVEEERLAVATILFVSGQSNLSSATLPENKKPHGELRR